MNDVLDLALDLLAEDRRAVAYRPSIARALGSVTAAILLQQIMHWYAVNGNQPFYKFKQACGHSSYRVGDSWTEELAFTRYEFDQAIAIIGCKITKGTSRSNAPDALVYYWTDMDRRTWFEVNRGALRKVVLRLYDKVDPQPPIKPTLDFTYTEMILKDDPENLCESELSALSDDLTPLCDAVASPGDFNTENTDTERETHELPTALTAVKEKANGSENEHAVRNGSGANKAPPPSVAPVSPAPKPAARKPKTPKVAQPTQYGDVFAALLATAFGVLPQMVKTGVSSPVPKSTKDRCGKVAKALLRDFPDATEADVRTFATDWLATHKNISFPMGEDTYPDHFGRWRLWKAKNATTTDRVPHPLYPIGAGVFCSAAEARAYTSEAAR